MGALPHHGGASISVPESKRPALDGVSLARFMLSSDVTVVARRLTV
jgi:hypothetical protein